MSRYATKLLYGLLGLLYGALAGLAWGWRHPAPEPLTDAVIHGWVDSLRANASSN